MKSGNDIIKFNTVTDPGILSAFADVYQKMRIQNEMVLKLVEILRENHLITYGQAHEILLLTLDQISDPAEREQAKKDIEKNSDFQIRKEKPDDDG